MCTHNVLSKNVKNIKIFTTKFSIFTAEKKSLHIVWASFHKWVNHVPDIHLLLVTFHLEFKNGCLWLYQFLVHY